MQLQSIKGVTGILDPHVRFDTMPHIFETHLSKVGPKMNRLSAYPACTHMAFGPNLIRKPLEQKFML